MTLFENLKNSCCKHYNLDPAHYFTPPGLAWGAALKVTEVKLELSDPDMLLTIEKRIRVVLSTISYKYGKSNNRYMGDKYDASKPTKYVTYLGANNLYRWAMRKPLPTHGFKWMETGELEIGEIIRASWRLI